MSRWDSVWMLGAIDTTWPLRSNANSGSGFSISSALPRLRRLASERAASRAACSGSAHGSAALLGAGEDAVDARVVQPLVRADHRPGERHPPHGPVVSDVHPHRHREPVGVRAQRAGVVGQGLGEHRLDAPGDVDARAAPCRLAVDGAARRDERADVGDVHPDADRPVVAMLRADRVVEVLGGDRVDGERRQVAQIAAPRLRPARHVVARPLCLEVDRAVEAAAQAAVEHERLEDVARVVRSPELADDPRVAAALALRAHDDEVPDAGTRVAVHDQLLPALEERLGDEEAPALGEHSDQFGHQMAGTPAVVAGCA